MAVTVSNSPSKWTPVYNHIVFDMISSNRTQPNFKYKIKLYVNNTLVHTSTYLPNPDGRCIYNARPIIKNYIKYSLKHNIDNFTYEGSDEVLKYYIEVYENYEGITDTIVWYSPDKYVYTGVADYEEAKSLSTYTLDNFIPQSANNDQDNAAEYLGPNKYPLINSPIGRISSNRTEMYNLRTDESKTVKLFSRNSTDDYKPNKLYVICKMNTIIGGSSTKILYRDITITAATGGNYDIISLPISIEKLNDGGWDSVQSDVAINNYIDPDQDTSFLIFLAKDSINGMTHKALAFNIVTCDPSHKDRKTIMYKSRKGGVWYIDAVQKSYENLKTEKQLMKNYLHYNYNDYSKERSVIEQKNTSVYTVNTDWIKHQGDLEDIKDMINSPLIYLIDADDKMIPVTLANSEYEFQDKKQSGLIQYSFSFIEAHDKNIVD